jgi:cystathionine beta-lyase/cystathionine gamma-synthase
MKKIVLSFVLLGLLPLQVLFADSVWRSDVEWTPQTNTLYGGTHNLFKETLPRYQIEAREVDTTRLENIVNAIDDKTRLIYIETPANPTLTVTDLRACAKIARDYKIPLVVDNTFPTPYFQRPSLRNKSPLQSLTLKGGFAII